MMSAIVMTQKFDSTAPAREKPCAAVTTEGLFRQRMTAIEALVATSSEPLTTTTETVTSVQTPAASVDVKSTSAVVSSVVAVETEAVPEENSAPAASETSLLTWLQDTVGFDNDDIKIMRRHKMKASSLRRATKEDFQDMGLVMGPIIDVMSCRDNMPL